MSLRTAWKSSPKRFDSTKSGINDYLNTIKRLIHCPRRRKVLFLAQLEDDIASYLSEHPSAATSDIIAEFGDPEIIAYSFIEETDKKKLGHLLKSRRWFRWMLAVTAIAISGAIVYFVIDYSLFFHGHYEVKPAAHGTYHDDIGRTY